MPLNSTRSIRFVAVPAAAIMAVMSACGAGDDEAAADPIIAVETSATASGDEPGDGESGDGESNSGETVDEEAAALAFATCMRDEGMDFPDPTVGADGSVTFARPGVGGGDGGGFATDPAFGDAVEVCRTLIEGAGFLPDAAEATEREDMMLDVARCLRENGVDVPDPDVAALGAGGGGPFGPDFDPDDPATAEAIDACQDVFSGLELGAGGR